MSRSLFVEDHAEIWDCLTRFPRLLPQLDELVRRRDAVG